MEQRISVVTLGVDDLTRARAFYADGLGWEPVMEADEVVFFQLNGLVLGLFGRADLAADAGLEDAGTGAGGMALGYNVRARADVDAVLAEAVAAGARLLKPGRDTFWGGYAGYFADPDGHLWEVAWNPPWPIDAQGNVTFAA